MRRLRRAAAGVLLAAAAVGALSGCSAESLRPPAPQLLQDVMDAKQPAGAPYLSMGGVIDRGTTSIGGGSTTLAAGTYDVTIACTGVPSVTFTIAFPGQTPIVRQATCGTPRTFTLTKQHGGFAQESASVPNKDHRPADTYAGFTRTSAGTA